MDKKQTLHQKIIDATLTEISTNGIENLTAKNISKRAKTSTGIIYHHFDTMEGLVFATYSELMNELVDRFGVASNLVDNFFMDLINGTNQESVDEAFKGMGLSKLCRE